LPNSLSVATILATAGLYHISKYSVAHCGLPNTPAKNVLQEVDLARCRWLKPVILATQETKIRRVAVQSQPGQIV
jgi:hypothetical protein